MTVEIATRVGPSAIDIAYERLGDPAHPSVVLVMGLGAQLIAWPDGFCDELVQRQLHVIRFDNRDVGLSTHVTSPYGLDAMAGDTVGLLDALHLDRVHLVGASMGGFIAQMIAIQHPQRVRSLTSMMSSTGDRGVGKIHPHVLKTFAGPPVTTRDDMIARSVEMFSVISSPAYPTDPASIAERSGRSFDRAFDPMGVMRQAGAIATATDRTAQLRTLAVPTLVIHGTADPLIDASGGRATAAAIPGARLVEIDGMGHDLPRELWPRFTELIADHVKASS